MTTKFVPPILIVGLAVLLSAHCRAENTGYWDIEIPVPKSATNVDVTEDRLFMTKSVSFDWEGEDTSALRDYYSEFFKSIGWEDPFADRSSFSTINQSGWGSFAMDFDQYDKPFAKYGAHWKATEFPAAGAIVLHLTGFEDGKLKGTAEAQITPYVELEASFRLLELLGNDPKNLFKLHDAVQGNPFDVHSIALPANYQEESDPLLAEYYQIVDEIIQEFRQWERDYVLD
jgi:hypothetical protein